jgi:Tfp pilus assembly protein PilX
MTEARQRAQHPDSGAALILVIGFIVMVGLIAGGLIGLTTSGLNNRSTLQIVRDRQYAADAAISQAIADARSRPPVTPCTAATGSTTYPKLNSTGVSIRVDWDNSCLNNTVVSSDGSTFPQRNMIFSAFCGDQTSADCNFAAVIIRAQVNFEPASGVTSKTSVQSWSVTR